MAKQLRGLIVDAASELNLEVGWSAVTMVRLAARVGVSRQTLYNEVGSKALLGELVVAAAAARLLRLLDLAFVSQPDDFVAGVRAAVEELLAAVAADPTLRALLAGIHGVDTGVLPTQRPEPRQFLGQVAAVVEQHLKPAELELTESETASLALALGRLVISAAVQPAGPPEQATDHLAWVVTRLLRAI